MINPNWVTHSFIEKNQKYSRAEYDKHSTRNSNQLSCKLENSPYPLVRDICVGIHLAVPDVIQGLQEPRKPIDQQSHP
jgi:hypothetical protein